MARNQTVTGTVHNLFALNRVRKECYYEPIRVDFSPIQKPNNQIEDIIPFFNKDGNFFTPSFIIRRQKITLEENLAVEKNKFEVRISHSQSSNEDQTPQFRPTDSRYCQLCQQAFADYWQHINGKYHKRMINASKFNKDIVNLCGSFGEKDQSKNPPKTKKIQKKKSDKISNKKKDLKAQEKTLGQINSKENMEMFKIQIKKQNVMDDIDNQNRKNIEQSLKITLQLGNYSTNMLSNNTFKQLFKES